MSDSQIVGSTFEEGLRAPHYINRRLLTAEDLKADQQTVLARLALLGRACGAGVVEGLTVEKTGGDTVSVAPGLGLNYRGNPVRLPRLTALKLGPQASGGVSITDAGRFQDCTLGVGGGPGGSSQGAYLLTAAPASRLEGMAPVQAAAGSASTPACAAQWEVEGLQFKAIRLAAFDGAPGVTATNRRNRLAHLCFGSAELPDLQRDLLSFGDSYGALSTITADALTACDLPLAVFYWTGSAVEFVDSWAVRRRLVQPAALTSLRGALSDRRVAEGQARLLQFQEQLSFLQQTVTGSLTAAAYFPLLPPAGLLPVRLPVHILREVVQPLVTEITALLANQLKVPVFIGVPINSLIFQFVEQITALTAQQAAQSGLDPQLFFGNLTVNYGLADRDTIDELLQRSLRRSALVLAGTASIDLLVAEEDVVHLIAAPLISAFQTTLAPFLSQFGLTGFVTVVNQVVSTHIRARLAALSGRPASQVTFDSRPLVGLFARPPRQTRYLGQDD